MLAVRSFASLSVRARLVAAAGSTSGARRFLSTSTPNGNGEQATDPASAAPPPPPPPSSQPSADAQVKALEVQLKESEGKYLRALAEMENVRARARRDVESIKQNGIQSLVKDMLTVVDTLSFATAAVDEGKINSATPEQCGDLLRQLHKGVSMTEREFLKLLNRYGVEVHDPLGKPFDPNLHMALFEVDATPQYPGGTVAVVQQRGYTLHGRPVRAASVGVARKS